MWFYDDGIPSFSNTNTFSSMTGVDLLPFYGPLALTHFGLQALFAHRFHQKSKKRVYISNKLPSVAIIIPVYNEDPELLEHCILRAYNSSYKGKKEIYIVDDGSKNIGELLPIYNKFNGWTGITVIINKENRGKRAIHKQVFDVTKSDIVITIDSDTYIADVGLKEIVRDFEDLNVGAVSGFIDVENANQNFLTKLIKYRYWTAFNQERAAQSLFGCVTCCSGPFSAYRNSVIQKVKESYATQRFLGHPCTFGDDRHLTNLILREGYKAVYNPRAVAYTHVPENLKAYAKQQIRWNKSFYREILWNALSVFKQSWYMTYDVAHQGLLVILLFFALMTVIIKSTQNPETLVRYALILLGIALLRSLYGIYRTRDLGFLAFLVYGFIYVGMLMPLKVVSLATLGKNGWGTR